MGRKYKTPQEEFWAGEFGDKYCERNMGQGALASNCALFAKILSRTRNVKSVIEFGANVGINLRALRVLLSEASLAAIEINKSAVKRLREWDGAEVFHDSILEFSEQRTWDLTLIKGVLIHLNPEVLPQVYDKLYHSSGRYICLIEYYNPTPVQVSYRGHTDRLYKRDFAGEMLGRFPGLGLIDYGFVYHGDPNFPQDDCTWFLLEKNR